MFISILIIAGVLALMFRLTGFVFKIFGKLLGVILGVTGYLILGGLAVGVLELAFFVLPIIFIVGIIAIVTAIAKM